MKGILAGLVLALAVLAPASAHAATTVDEMHFSGFTHWSAPFGYYPGDEIWFGLEGTTSADIVITDPAVKKPDGTWYVFHTTSDYGTSIETTSYFRTGSGNNGIIPHQEDYEMRVQVYEYDGGF